METINYNPNTQAEQGSSGPRFFPAHLFALCRFESFGEIHFESHISAHINLSRSQHGFRPSHSTSRHLTKLTDFIVDDFNNNKPPLRTILASIDIPKPFEKTSRHILSDKITATSIPPIIQKWLNSKMVRLSRTLFMSRMSHARYLPNGVPQGSALSPALFNLRLSSLPELEDTLILSYADVLILAARDKKISTASTRLQTHLDLLESWLVTNHLSPSPFKSSVTLFTSDRRQLDQHPELKIFGERLPI
ncbi:uncharacterized protein LOC115229537 [Octopus sinensis]|uniref:Uncharacterized protein LOC115229537 n=1 Tax=Octopus sinensis TaxID=2607531 RepID=A0A6P7TTU5_9MOLL|nr:uncharacterized protein LOC115229537 [Octopus sinensis]